MNEAKVFSQIGEEGITAMVAAFYRRLPDDDLIGPMYKGDMAGGEERLRDFLLFRIGGQTDYLEKRGHPRLRMRHAPFQVDIRARNRWMKLMDEAMDEVGIDEEPKKELHKFFFDVADFLRNVPEADGPFKI